MKKYNILIIDDDPDIVEVIMLYLNKPNYKIYTANSSKDALKLTKQFSFNLILLDIMLPDMDGTCLCKKIRQYIYCPILFISCIDDEEYILNALSLGGDDYIRKPFNPRELAMRVESNLRRVEYDKKPEVTNDHQMIVRDLKIDLDKHLILRDQKEISLSPLEFSILIYMVNNPNKALSYSDIYNNVWKSDCIGDTRTVMVHVSNLRKKIENNNKEIYIKTLKKKGYIFLL